MQLLRMRHTLLPVLPLLALLLPISAAGFADNVKPTLAASTLAEDKVEAPVKSSTIKSSIVQDEVKLAMEIVQKYRTLREECSSLPENLRPMCLYRLNIGNWDYKEAKSILARHNLL